MNCIMRRSAPEMRRYLETVPNSPAEVKMFLAARPGECLDDAHTGAGNGAVISSRFSRGAVAEFALRRDFAAVGQLKAQHRSVPVFAPLTAMQLDVLRTTNDGRDLDDVVTLTAIECVVRADPVGAFELFRTELRSPEERAVIVALQPRIGECYPAGKTFALDRSTLRALVAEAAYRVSVEIAASRPPG